MREFSRLYTWIIIQHRVSDAPAHSRAILVFRKLPLSVEVALHVPHSATVQHAVLKSLIALKAQSHAAHRAGFIPPTTAKAQRQAPARLVVTVARAHLATVHHAVVSQKIYLAIKAGQASSAVASLILNQTHAAKVFHLVLKGSALNALHCVTNQALAVVDLEVALPSRVEAHHSAAAVHLLDHLADQAAEALAVLVVRRGMRTRANTSTPLNLLIRQ